MRLLSGIGRFLYDFIVGDDWKVAASVVFASVVAGLLILTDALSPVPLAVVATSLYLLSFAGAVLADVRKER